MSNLADVIAQLSPSDVAELQAALGQAPAAPSEPPSILDEIRSQEHGLTVTEVPNANELPAVVGVLCKRLRDLENSLSGSGVADAEAPAPAPEGEQTPPAPAGGWPAPDAGHKVG